MAWHGRPVPDLLLAYKALLVGCLQVTGSCSTGVGCKHPVIVLRVQLRFTSNRLVCLLHVGAQYSTDVNTIARAEVRSVDGLAPHPVPTSLRMSALRAMTYLLILQK